MAMAKGNIAVGIDLGTTNSCVAIYKNGKVETLSNRLGGFLTPSWVTYTDKEVLIGQIAKDQAARNAFGSVYGIKRIIGRQYNDPIVQNVVQNSKFKVKEVSGVLKLEVLYKKKKTQVHPEEISGLILKEMKEIAELRLEEQTVTDAVITVPAYFNDRQRQATFDAAEIAGLNVLRLINEPTAAAIAYIYDKPEKEQRNILVYDLGGGTFDVSIVSLEGTNVKVKATFGDANLGGVNFDDRCISYFLKLIQDKHEINMPEAIELKLLYRLRHQVETAKEHLSSMLTTEIDLQSIWNDIDVVEDFSRARLDDINDDLFQKTFEAVEQCIREAKLEKEDIDDVLLVGGSSRIIRIEEELKQMFGKPVNKAVNQDQAVAHGAAILAAKLNGTLPRELNILDVTAMSLGIEIRNNEMSFLIKRNTQIPTEAQCVYTVRPGENATRITVLEGDDTSPEKNLVLGVFDLLDLPADPSVHIKFTIDINGILTVTAVETSSGIKKTINVTTNKGRLNPKEILSLQRQSIAIKDGNRELNAVKEKKNQFESFLFKVKDDIKRNKCKISVRDKDIMFNRIDDALMWLTSKDADDVKKIDNKYITVYKYYSDIPKN